MLTREASRSPTQQMVASSSIKPANRSGLSQLVSRDLCAGRLYCMNSVCMLSTCIIYSMRHCYGAERYYIMCHDM